MERDQMTEFLKRYRHACFCIGETLVDESKQHISAEEACRKIREYLQGVPGSSETRELLAIMKEESQ